MVPGLPAPSLRDPPIVMRTTQPRSAGIAREWVNPVEQRQCLHASSHGNATAALTPQGWAGAPALPSGALLPGNQTGFKGRTGASASLFPSVPSAGPRSRPKANDAGKAGELSPPLQASAHHAAQGGSRYGPPAPSILFILLFISLCTALPCPGTHQRCPRLVQRVQLIPGRAAGAPPSLAPPGSSPQVPCNMF